MHKTHKVKKKEPQQNKNETKQKSTQDKTKQK